MSLSRVFHELKGINLLPLIPPFPNYRPRKHDPAARCEYHMGQKGHATNTCWKLKNEIQDLIDAGIIQIKENGLGRDEIIVNMMG